MFLEHESRLERAWLRVFQDFARNGFYSFSFMCRMATFGYFWGRTMENWHPSSEDQTTIYRWFSDQALKPSMSPCIGYFPLPRLIKPMNFGICKRCLDKPLFHHAQRSQEFIDSMARWLECVDCHVLAALFTFIHIWYMGVSENDLYVPGMVISKEKLRFSLQILPSTFLSQVRLVLDL